MNVFLSLFLLVSVVAVITLLFGWLWQLDDEFAAARPSLPADPDAPAPPAFELLRSSDGDARTHALAPARPAAAPPATA